MLKIVKFKRVTDQRVVERIISSMTTITAISFGTSSSTVKKIEFNSDEGRGYITGEYSDIHIYLEEKEETKTEEVKPESSSDDLPF